MTFQEPADGFNEDFIFYVLEELVFEGGGAKSFGRKHTGRFGGIYGLHSVAYACALVSVQLSEIPLSHHLFSRCIVMLTTARPARRPRTRSPSATSARSM